VAGARNDLRCAAATSTAAAAAVALALAAAAKPAPMSAAILKHLPNALTLLRAVLIPVIALLLWQQRYGAALVLFALCALSDLADGWLARRFDVRTRFGAIADPLADKLAMLAATVLLTWHGWLPWWFAALVVGRDVMIVAGAAAYHLCIGRVEVAPTRLSKFNTGLEFTFLTGVMAAGAGLIDKGLWWTVLLYLTTTTILASGTQYALLWGGKAVRALRARTPG